MEIQKRITGYIISILFAVGFCISIPVFAMAEEATAETDQGVVTSDTSDSASQPITDSKGEEDNSRVEEADNSPVISSAEPETGKDKPDAKDDKKKDEEEEPEETEPEMDTEDMSMVLGGEGTGA